MQDWTHSQFEMNRFYIAIIHKNCRALLRLQAETFRCQTCALICFSAKRRCRVPVAAGPSGPRPVAAARPGGRAQEAAGVRGFRQRKEGAGEGPEEFRRAQSESRRDLSAFRFRWSVSICDYVSHLPTNAVVRHMSQRRRRLRGGEGENWKFLHNPGPLRGEFKCLARVPLWASGDLDLLTPSCVFFFFQSDSN